MRVNNWASFLKLKPNKTLMHTKWKCETFYLFILLMLLLSLLLLQFLIKIDANENIFPKDIYIYIQLAQRNFESENFRSRHIWLIHVNYQHNLFFFRCLVFASFKNNIEMISTRTVRFAYVGIAKNLTMMPCRQCESRANDLQLSRTEPRFESFTTVSIWWANWRVHLCTLAYVYDYSTGQWHRFLRFFTFSPPDSVGLYFYAHLTTILYFLKNKQFTMRYLLVLLLFCLVCVRCVLCRMLSFLYE